LRLLLAIVVGWRGAVTFAVESLDRIDKEVEIR